MNFSVFFFRGISESCEGKFYWLKTLGDLDGFDWVWELVFFFWGSRTSSHVGCTLKKQVDPSAPFLGLPSLKHSSFFLVNTIKI